MEAFASALKKSKELLIKIIRSDQSATYEELIINGPLPNHEELIKELRALNTLINLRVSEDDVDENVKNLINMFSLFDYHKYISWLIEVVSDFDLQVCLDDDMTIELKGILEECSDSKRCCLTSKVASGYLIALKSALMLNDSTEHMKLFHEIKKYRALDFYKFITDLFFPTGLKDTTQGVNSFRAWYEIISNQLQNVEYEQQVLHQLSLAFEHILPFVDKSKNLQQLMSAVVQLDSSNGFQEIGTVATNMHHIERWSSQAEV
jgi:hypothetical protein